MKLSEIKGEKAFSILADLIEPIQTLAADEDFRKVVAEKTRLDIIKYLLKEQSSVITKILAILEGEDPATYEPNLLTLPVKLLEFMNDPVAADLFGLQGQTTEKTSSGSATENTGATEA